jgi:hypothetical protein
MVTLTVSVMEEGLAVCRLAPTALIPQWVWGSEFVSITRTADELSIVCREELVPSGVHLEAGWRALRVEGPLDFGMVGVLAALVQPLADASISVLAISTFDTDYLLVQAASLDRSLEALRTAGHIVRTVQKGSEGQEPLHTLTLGQAKSPAQRGLSSSAPPTRWSMPGVDLGEIEIWCRRKAEIVRWIAESERMRREGTDSPTPASLSDSESSRWAEAVADSFYFASAKAGSNSAEISLLDDLGGCFEAVAESVALAGEARQHGKLQDRVLRFVAEAQSALRRALQRLEIREDPEQESVYEWLRATAARERVYLRRHMRADDLADPAEWPSLLGEIERAIAGSRRPPSEIGKLELIRHHQTVIQTGRETGEDWPALIAAVDDLVSGGLQPSNRELRELLLPIIDLIPDRDDLPPRFNRVLIEIDRFLALRPQLPSTESVAEPAPEILRVARLLGGRSLVLIGGNRRRDSQEALRRAFGLDSLIWIETKEHQSIHSFEPQIARPEVVLVLLAIRWSSHAFGEVRHVCDSHHKPLVRLPGGYNPNQVAVQILAQCSQQLTSIGSHASDRE